jgi:hypothetical protein
VKGWEVPALLGSLERADIHYWTIRSLKLSYNCVCTKDAIFKVRPFSVSEIEDYIKSVALQRKRKQMFLKTQYQRVQLTPLVQDLLGGKGGNTSVYHTVLYMTVHRIYKPNRVIT